MEAKSSANSLEFPLNGVSAWFCGFGPGHRFVRGLLAKSPKLRIFRILFGNDY
jgi:hypothetical protein